MPTTDRDPNGRPSPATTPWTTGRHRHGRNAVPPQQSAPPTPSGPTGRPASGTKGSDTPVPAPRTAEPPARAASSPDPTPSASSPAAPGPAVRAPAVPERTGHASTSPEPETVSTPAGTGSPEERGSTEIADRVVQRIAAAAIGEISEIGAPAPRVLGVTVGSEDPGHRPDVTATVHGTDVDLAVRASVRYPAPIADVVGRARSRAAARIARATGLQVRHLDVTVTALSTDPAPDGRVVG